MNTIYVLVILFFNQHGAMQGGTARFQTQAQCQAGSEQAKKDFDPQQITTVCVKMEEPEQVIEQPKKKYKDA